MSVLFEKTYPRTVHALVERFMKPEMRGAKMEAWLFDDRPSRFAAEMKLREAGVEARFRSAYKPLLHFFLEEVDSVTLRSAAIRYPRHDACVQNRFLLETYPLSALLPGVDVTFAASGKDDFHYEVDLLFADGNSENHRVFAPNRVHEDFIGETLVSPTGWLSITHHGRTDSERFETSYEKLFHDTISAIAAHDWKHGEPYFDELNIAVSLPITDRRLPYDEEGSASPKPCTRISISRCSKFSRKSPAVRSGIVVCNRARSYRKSAFTMRLLQSGSKHVRLPQLMQ
ncbi:hypothetical protein Q644_21110 [Brucella intermedia 229E]|uniref:Uncharacterized protein n=1 Tax=Brucella intermedia 229E TaxID=1337887 RepID=U4VA37_9HYPH|nr:hypothetical protein Q644_21110 [Brucella intermedia 229E]